ncbi:MAG: hypothetical protein JWQ43_2689 [Glaciihabitans sp.]|nr:hypothetical protein [Glaciihabitans sp.]
MSTGNNRSATAAYTTAERVRIIVVGLAVPVVIAAAGVIAVLGWVPSLPDPIATHWSGAGPDGYGSVGGMIALIVGLSVGFAALMTAAVLLMPAPVIPTHTPRILIGAGVFLAAMVTVAMTASIAMQRGLVDAAQAPGVGQALLAGVGVGLVLGFLAWLGTPESALRDPDEEVAPAVLQLAPTERVAWTRTARPGVVMIVAIMVFIVVFGAIAVAAVSSPDGGDWWTLAVVAAVIVVGVASFFWRVRIDARGLAVTSALGLPRFRLPLAEIESVRAVDVNPLPEFGGWGIRFGGGRLGVVVRAGEAIEVARASGKIFVVTVDDAATAAALLGGLIGRRAASSES